MELGMLWKVLMVTCFTHARSLLCPRCSFDFSNVTHNNLAGLGPDAGLEDLRYGSVCQVEGEKLDLIVTALTPVNLRPFVQGEAHVAAHYGSTALMRFELVTAGTNMPFNMGNSVITMLGVDEAGSAETIAKIHVPTFDMTVAVVQGPVAHFHRTFNLDGLSPSQDCAEPTPQPTAEPTPQPTAAPTTPTPQPTTKPTPQPTKPTPLPTLQPTKRPKPTPQPSPEPGQPLDVRTFCVETKFERPIRLYVRQRTLTSQGIWQGTTQFVSQREDRACIRQTDINLNAFDGAKLDCHFSFIDPPSSTMSCGGNYRLKKDSNRIAVAKVQDLSEEVAVALEEASPAPAKDRRVRTICVESDNTSPVRLVVTQNTSHGFWRHATRYVSLGLRHCIAFDTLRAAVDGFPIQCQYNRAGFEHILNKCSGENFILDRFKRSLGVYECNTMTCRASMS
jgi:hypothetical protein